MDYYETSCEAECLACGCRLNGHHMCEACHILLGKGKHVYNGRIYRRYKLCEGCIRRWQLKERNGKKFSYEEMIKSNPVKEVRLIELLETMHGLS